MTVVIDQKKIGVSAEPYILAELSANHNGSLERALATMDAAKACGVDAIKLQTYSADTMTIDCDSPEFMIRGGLWDGYKLYDLYRWAQTPYEWHEAMFDHARKIGITVFSTPFDETAVDLLESLNAPAYKIASFELIDLHLIRYVAQTAKPIIMSTGMGSLEEILEAVQAARDNGCKELILLHCISGYPTPVDQSNLMKIPELAKLTGCPVGLSDHTLGTVVSTTAVALGACLIEKHFTLSRADKGPDCEFSLEPAEMKQLVQDTKDAWSALGSPTMERQAIEKGNLQFRRSLYFVKDKVAGSIIGPDDVRRIRPGFGLAPKFYHQILGKKVNRDIQFGEPVQLEDFE